MVVIFRISFFAVFIALLIFVITYACSPASKGPPVPAQPDTLPAALVGSWSGQVSRPGFEHSPDTTVQVAIGTNSAFSGSRIGTVSIQGGAGSCNYTALLNDADQSNIRIAMRSGGPNCPDANGDLSDREDGTANFGWEGPEGSHTGRVSRQ
jgi:hypothetical protein